ncbi:MAG TPA: peroxide stress protein YaaA [Albitalea sp.]|nr:peroxide stress protein YaaA [Albitalea sp.]
MLFVLSPAKSLDYDTPAPFKTATTPQFIPRSVELIATLKTKSVADIAELMDLSESLATLNVDRYAAWSPKFTAKNSKAAVFAFNGDVYDGLAARTLSEADLAWAQQHVAILSGLYGVLRPFDKLQPYRLEMGTPLATARGRNLYDYWGDTIAEHLNAQVAADRTPVIVNLASQEYFRAADRQALKPRVIDCVFEDWKGGRYKVISFFAKKARGLMARHAIQKRIATPKRLEGFDLDGYAFAPDVSEPDRLVFRRRVAG